MRVNCGPTWEIRWKLKHQRLESWHKWFAWRPVRLTGLEHCAWLETVQRRGQYGGYYGGGNWEWEYKE